MSLEQQAKEHLREVLEYCDQLGYNLGLTALEARQFLETTEIEASPSQGELRQTLAELLAASPSNVTCDNFKDREDHYHSDKDSCLLITNYLNALAKAKALVN